MEIISMPTELRMNRRFVFLILGRYVDPTSGG
jgi:hypothetical protein